MSVLLSINGGLVATTNEHAGTDYRPVEVGKPLAVELLTFFPGSSFKGRGCKAELMITSQVRLGPVQDPAPQKINMMLRNYLFKKASPVQDYGADVYGDPMLYYTKAYVGERLGITLNGVEMDKIKPELWRGIGQTLSKAGRQVGRLGMFTAAAPYFDFIRIAAKVGEVITKAAMRNDRLDMSRVDLYPAPTDKRVLQSARYVLWNDKKGIGSASMRNK